MKTLYFISNEDDPYPQMMTHNLIVENKKRERMQREEGENAERRGRETERRERRQRLKMSNGSM